MGGLRDQVGRQILRLELPPAATWRVLLDAIAPLVENSLAVWARDRHRRSFSTRVMVARNQVVGHWGDATELNDDDEILVFPPLAGG
jgi:molybdopterin converting factor small subunit